MITGTPVGCSSDKLASSVLSRPHELLTSAMPVFNILLSDSVLNPQEAERLTQYSPSVHLCQWPTVG